MTLGYLQVNQNPNSRVRADGRRYWGYPTRSKRVQVIVIHTAEIDPGPGSAEAIARYFTRSTRAASYHEVGDVDSYVTCLPPDATAFGARGWNSNAWHWSFATRAHLWGTDPEWDTAALNIGADRCRTAAARFGIPPRLITLKQAQAGQLGFIPHGWVDPGRRSDPGARFPWERFMQFVNGMEDDIVASLGELRDVVAAENRVVLDRTNEATRLAQAACAGAVAAIRADVGLDPDPESDLKHVARIRAGEVTGDGQPYDLREVRARLQAKAGINRTNRTS